MPTRREFLPLTAAVLLGGPAALAAAAGPPAPPPPGGDPESALSTGKPKALPYEALEGFLSKTQLGLHHGAHYTGAVKSLGQIETALGPADRAAANANWSEVRELKREQVHAMNSVVLHELYFAGMAAAGGSPTAAVDGTLKGRFGSLDKWLEDFLAAAKAARGWAILAAHPVNGRLYNVVVDVHDVGVPVAGVPLVVLDCYEHAFYVDYQQKKADYIAAYPKAIAWAEVDRRVRQFGA